MSTIKPRKVIFSFAGYAKEIISTIKSSTNNIHVTPGLTSTEISSMESTTGVTFPPDLRCILSEGLPVGPGFPNWRSSSRHQLHLLTSLPVLSLVKEVSRNLFWVPSWGPRPENDDEAVEVAKDFLEAVPKLVPVFRNCYIPCEPSLAGNPILYVHGGEIRLLSEDISQFYKTTQFRRKDWVLHPKTIPTARTISFWTHLSQSRDAGCRSGWWKGKLGECLEEVVERLREGGWGEDDVREMMMMDGGDERVVRHHSMRHVRDVDRHVRGLCYELIRSGWSVEDVVYSFGDGFVSSCVVDHGENCWVDIHCHSSNGNSLVLSR